MVVEQIEVAVGKFLAKDRLDAVGQKAAVDADKNRLGQFADEGGDVFLLHIGVGVILRASGGIRGVDIVAQEVDFLADFAVFGVFLATSLRGITKVCPFTNGLMSRKA